MLGLRGGFQTGLVFALVMPGVASAQAYKPNIDKDKPPTCANVSQQDIDKTGRRTIDEAVRNLPPLSKPKTGSICPPPKSPPPVKGIPLPPQAAPRPLGDEGAANGPKLAPTPTEEPPDLVKDITPELPIGFKEFENYADGIMFSADWAQWVCDDRWLAKLIPQLYQLEKRAEEIAAAARAAGEASSIDPAHAEDLARDLRETIADAISFKCPPTERIQSNLSKYLQGPRLRSTPVPSGPKKAEDQAPEPKSPEDKSIRVPAVQFEPMSVHLSVKDKARIVYIHNEERFLVHAQPLRWSDDLEPGANAWAREMARTRELAHAPKEGRGIVRENLQKGLKGWSADRMMQDWRLEKRDFKLGGGYYPEVALDGDWMHVSHYTQMIWPTTTDIACGEAEADDYVYMDCRYSPGGNKDGKPVGPIAGPSVSTIGAGGSGAAITGPPETPDIEPPKLPPAEVVAPAPRSTGSSRIDFSPPPTEPQLPLPPALQAIEAHAAVQSIRMKDARESCDRAGMLAVLSALQSDAQKAHAAADEAHKAKDYDTAEAAGQLEQRIRRRIDDARYLYGQCFWERG